MKISKKILFLLSLTVLSLSACNGGGSSDSSAASSEESTSSYNPEDDGPYTGQNPYVKKVANMPDDFVLGMDSSSVLSLEESGVKYYDFDGEEKDLFKILAGQGVNTIRVRIWVDPFVDIAGLEDYSASKTYGKGRAVKHENALYKCSTKIETAEAWNVNHWEKVATYYSESATYAVGDQVIQNNLVYKCKTAITAGEAFNADHWELAFCDGKIGYGGGNVDIDRAVEIGKRVTAAGMKLMANFHYSDFWADPGRQLEPKAWKGQTFEQKKVSLYNYTKQSMQKFKDANVDVAYVQVGNETTKGMAGVDHDKELVNFSALVSQGTKAVKEVYPNAQTIVHFTNPESGSYTTIANNLSAADCQYDIFGTSYYPFFHGTLDNLVKQLNAVTRRTGGKKVMVCETSYAYTDEDTDYCGNQFTSESSYDQFYPVTQGGQIANFRNICDAMVNQVRDHLGAGVCYWEGTWISVNKATWDDNRVLWERDGSGWAADWAAEYDPEVEKYGGGGTVVDNQCFFDKNGKPLDSLKMFSLLKTGNRTEEWVEGAEDASVEYMTNEDIKLPSKIRAIYNSDNRRDTDVTWDLSKAYSGENEIALGGDINKLKEQGPGVYKVKGSIKDGDKTFYAYCSVKLETANYINDPSFEENKNGTLVPGKSSDYTGSDAWKITDGAETNDGYLWITNGNDNHPVSGKFDVHGYSIGGHFNYNLTQEGISTQKEASVKLRFFVTGGATAVPIPEDVQHSYAALYEDGTEVKRVEFKITKWGENHTIDADDITLKPGKSYKLVIHVEIDSPGVWFDLDDVNLYE